MLVVISMPCASGRWPGTHAFGVLGDDNTCIFRYPPGFQGSVRLFLGWFLIACNQTASNDKTGISIRISPHATLMASDQRSTHRVVFCWLSRVVACYKAMATSTFPTGIPGIDSTGENASIVRFVLRILENAPFHPVRSLLIASFAIRAFRRLEVAKMLKYEHSCLMLFGKLDNTSTHQMGDLLICIADLVPKIHIVLLISSRSSSVR